MDAIIKFLHDAQEADAAGDRDSNGMVKVYPRHGNPISGWVTFVEDDGTLAWMSVAVPPPPDPRQPWSTTRDADSVRQGDYEIAVRIDDLYAVRFTDLHEFVSDTSY